MKFNLPERNEESSFVIIVLDLSKGDDIFRIGSIVDRVKDVLSIEDSEIKPVPAMSREFNTEFIQGIYKQNNEFIMLLDVEKVFSSDELTNLREGKLIEEQVSN